MHHDHLSLWPVAGLWGANGFFAWAVGGLSPLQVLLMLVTIGYTLHRWVLLRRGKKED